MYVSIFLAIVATAFTACGRFNLYGQFVPLSSSAVATNSTSGSSGSSASPLTISPAVDGVLVGGTADFAASGGTPPYSFTVLSGGAGGKVTSSGVYTAPSQSGTDTVQLADKVGLISDATITVIAAQPLQISPAAVTLNGGSTFQFAASGGVSPYTYAVSTGSGTVTSAGSYTAPGSAGSYTVQVTDHVANTSKATVTVLSNGSGSPLVVTPASASVAEGGTMTFAGAGGTPPYTFSVSSGTASPSGESLAYTAPVAAGSATVTVTDNVGATATATVTILPAAPSGLTAKVISGQEIDLTWTNNSADAKQIDIWRAQPPSQSGASLSFVLLTKVGNNTTSYQDTSVSSSSVYVYALTATTTLSGGTSLSSGYSNEAIGTTP